MEQIRDISVAKRDTFSSEYLSSVEDNLIKVLWSTLWKGKIEGRQVLQNQSVVFNLDFGKPAQTL